MEPEHTPPGLPSATHVSPPAQPYTYADVSSQSGSHAPQLEQSHPSVASYQLEEQVQAAGTAESCNNARRLWEASVVSPRGFTRITLFDVLARAGLRAVSVTRDAVTIAGAPVDVTVATLPIGTNEFGPDIRNSASRDRSVSDHPAKVSEIVARVPEGTTLRTRFCIWLAHCESSAVSLYTYSHPAFVLKRIAREVSNAEGDNTACSPDKAQWHCAGTASHTILALLPYTYETDDTNATTRHRVMTRRGQFSSLRRESFALPLMEGVSRDAEAPRLR
jgi:hypothetical protein